MSTSTNCAAKGPKEERFTLTCTAPRSPQKHRCIWLRRCLPAHKLIIYIRINIAKELEINKHIFWHKIDQTLLTRAECWRPDRQQAAAGPTSKRGPAPALPAEHTTGKNSRRKSARCLGRRETVINFPKGSAGSHSAQLFEAIKFY